jgi:hypothetical protein
MLKMPRQAKKNNPGKSRQNMPKLDGHGFSNIKWGIKLL